MECNYKILRDDLLKLHSKSTQKLPKPHGKLTNFKSEIPQIFRENNTLGLHLILQNEIK